MNPRVRMALIVVASMAILAAASVIVFADTGEREPTLPSGFAGAVSPEGIPPLDFRLRDEDGRMRSLADSRGQVTILTFLYSTCEDTCPTTAAQIRLALDDLGHEVPVLAISVDPAGDTADNVNAFLLKQALSNGRMHFLMGSEQELAPIWEAYGVRPQGDGFDHSARVLLLDRSGSQRVAFPTEALTPEGLVHDVRLLEAEPAD